MVAKPVVYAICISVLACIVMIIALVVSSVGKVDMTDIGIKYDKLAKTLGENTYSGGLHLGSVGFEFLTAPSVYKTISSEITCLNKDGVVIKLSVTYQYKVQAKNFRKVLLQFKDVEGLSTVLVFVGESVLHSVCSRFDTSNFQFERKRFTDTVQMSITEQFNEYFTDVSGLQISNYDRPLSFEKAIERKMTAFEDINVAKKERKAEKIQAETDLKIASAQANITLQNAQSYKHIRESQADSKAAIIKEQFDNEIKVYSELVSQSGLQFTSKGLLSYMGIRTLENSPNRVQLAIKNPAEFSP